LRQSPWSDREELADSRTRGEDRAGSLRMLSTRSPADLRQPAICYAARSRWSSRASRVGRTGSGSSRSGTCPSRAMASDAARVAEIPRFRSRCQRGSAVCSGSHTLAEDGDELGRQPAELGNPLAHQHSGPYRSTIACRSWLLIGGCPRAVRRRAAKELRR
jgi:hypothetical protein